MYLSVSLSLYTYVYIYIYSMYIYIYIYIYIHAAALFLLNTSVGVFYYSALLMLTVLCFFRLGVSGLIFALCFLITLIDLLSFFL